MAVTYEIGTDENEPSLVNMNKEQAMAAYLRNVDRERNFATPRTHCSLEMYVVRDGIRGRLMQTKFDT